MLFVCENNLFAMGTAVDRHEAEPDLCTRPRAFGIRAEKANGMDVLAVDRAARRLAEEVRETKTPRFLELMTYRYRAHSMYDAELYRTKEEVTEWSTQHNPLVDFRRFLQAEGWLDDEADRKIEEEVARIVAAAVAEAEAGELEPVADLLRDVLTPSGTSSP